MDCLVRERATNSVCGKMKYNMVTKPVEVILIKWVGTSHGFDKSIFWQDVNSTVSVNGQDISALSLSNLNLEMLSLCNILGITNQYNACG